MGFSMLRFIVTVSSVNSTRHQIHWFLVFGSGISESQHEELPRGQQSEGSCRDSRLHHARGLRTVCSASHEDYAPNECMAAIARIGLGSAKAWIRKVFTTGQHQLCRRLTYRSRNLNRTIATALNYCTFFYFV